jgi:hypothetical protein
MKMVNVVAREIFAAIGLAGVLVYLITGCSTLGVPSADTFNKKWLAAQTADTAVLQMDLTLLQAEKISKEDAANVEAQADNVKSGLDIARTLYATDQTAGSTKLDSVVIALQAIQNYLAAKGK